ncbi:MAG: imidazole glycerol phosphate synthase subunit HisF [bacterium]|nr:imidazole glycerol phosphate synthase subunit HisF [bacterium]
MLCKRIIPCLDVTGGRVVKGTNFVDLIDAGDPVELGHKYDTEGADELTYLDITASSDKRDILADLVERTGEKVFIPFTVGGGINDIETIHTLLSAGADKVSINTAAVKNPQLIKDASSHFGNQCIVVAIDAKQTGENKWEIFTHGGRTPTGLDVVEWAKRMNDYGAGEILLTSMDKDGTQSGYDIPLTKAVAQSVSIPVIASGGAGNVQDIVDVLKVCDAALLASLLHFRTLSVQDIKIACRNAGIPVR